VKLRVVATACVGKLLGLESRLEHRTREKRIPCDPSTVRITAEGDLETVDGYVVNVSKSGLKLRTDKYFRCARKVAIEMAGLLIRGSIRYRCVQTTNPGSFEMGVRIDDVASSNLKAQSR
jgi:PilZ domain